VTLSWDPPTTGASFRYHVYQKPAGSWDYAMIGTTGQLGFHVPYPGVDAAPMVAVSIVTEAGVEGPLTRPIQVPFRAPIALEGGHVDRPRGNVDDGYRFTVMVADGAAPVVEVIVDGVPHAMTRADDRACERWCTYAAVVRLAATRMGEGAHHYYFVARATDKASRFPAEGAIDGPVVVATVSGASKIPSAGLAEVALVLSAAAALVAIAWARKRRT